MVEMPGCERLSSLDAMFLHLEDASAHMHMGGVFVCEGPPPSHGELLAHLASRLDRVPRYRQRLSFVPLGLGRPAWVDDGAFELSHHVRRVATAATGVEALEVVAARVFSEPLDLHRPLWGIDLVEGVGVDRFALVTRVHHCLVDGIGGCGIISAITDDVPELAASSPVASWAPRPEPPPAARLAYVLRDQVARPLELLLDWARPGSDGRRMLHDLVEGLVPLAALALHGRAPISSLNSPIGAGRRYTMASIDLAAVKRVHALAGGTINDVLLSVVAGALRTLLHRRGVSHPDQLLAFVPVNERPPGTQGCSGNHLSAVYCPLPVDEPDPVRRLRSVSAAMDRLKSQGQATGLLIVRDLGEFTPPVLAAPAARLELAYRRFNVVVSNIRGPEAPRYLLGRRIRSFHPAVPLAPGQTLSVGLLSYAGSIGVGLLGDAEEATDLPLLARSVEDAFEALAVQTGAAPGAPGPAVRPVREPPGPATARNRTAGSSILPPAHHGRAAARRRPRGGAPPLASRRDVRRPQPGRHHR
jgi:WS/DGAT/MGAT family acyltransferase